MDNVKKFADIYKLSRGAAEHFVTLSQYAIKERGRFSVALSGGGTPESLYALLATEAYSKRVEWEQVHLFWGDERCVPPVHKDSNYMMAYHSLIHHVHIPDSNVHRVKGEHKPEEAAIEYENELRAFFGEIPRFDLILLGLGEDGHTASLFPNEDAAQEVTRWAMPTFVDKLRVWRITLTLPVINNAANIDFLVTGGKKAETVRDVIKGEYQPENLPAQLIKPDNGQLLWLLDEEAASLL